MIYHNKDEHIKFDILDSDFLISIKSEDKKIRIYHKNKYWKKTGLIRDLKISKNSKKCTLKFSLPIDSVAFSKISKLGIGKKINGKQT